MKYVVLFLILSLTLAGSAYCLRAMWMAWLDARAWLKHPRKSESGRLAKRRVTAKLAGFGLEVGTCALFLLVAVATLTKTLQSDEVLKSWTVSQDIQSLEMEQTRARWLGSDGARGIAHRANSLPDRPIIGVDFCGQPLTDARPGASRG